MAKVKYPVLGGWRNQHLTGEFQTEDFEFWTEECLRAGGIEDRIEKLCKAVATIADSCADKIDVKAFADAIDAPCGGWNVELVNEGGESEGDKDATLKRQQLST